VKRFSFLLIFFISFANAELKVYDWEGYVSTEIIAQFEQETGIKVSLKTFSNLIQLDGLINSNDDVDLIANL